MSRKPLKARAEGCLSLFEKIIEKTEPTYSRSSNKISCRIPWHDQYSRSQIWCADWGARKEPEDEGSLDYRVCDADNIDDMFKSLFKELRDKLSQVEIQILLRPAEVATNSEDNENQTQGGKSRLDLGNHVTVLESMFATVKLIVDIFYSLSGLLRDPDKYAKDVLWET